MNTPSPLIPQGSLSQMKGRSNVQLAVITIVAIHVVFFGGLLLQGCKRDTKTADGGSATDTNVIDTLSYGPIDTNAGMYYTSPTSLPADSSTIQTSAPIATTPDYSLSQPVTTGFETPAASTSTEPAEPVREMKQ